MKCDQCPGVSQREQLPVTNVIWNFLEHNPNYCGSTQNQYVLHEMQRDYAPRSSHLAPLQLHCSFHHFT